MFTADQIDDGIWLGDYAAAENSQALDQFGITHLVTILDYEPKKSDKCRTRLFVCAEDFQSTDLLTKEFERCFQFIDQAIQQGHRVLIHCQQGISRSATIAAMYLMRKYSLTRDQALERLTNQRRHCPVKPNDGFLTQLDLFHRMNYTVNIEHELYKQFQNERFRPVIQTTDTITKVMPLLEDENIEYKCRNCHFKLFTNSDVQKHEPCDDNSILFTFYLDWIDEIFLGDPIGTIRCPQCQVILGEYSLKGLRCSCRHWIQPGFAFQHQTIE